MSGTIDSLIGNMFRPLPARWKQKAMEYMWSEYRLGMIEHFARNYSVGLPEGETNGSIELAMDSAEKLMSSGYLITFDTLGEKSKSIDDVRGKIQINNEMVRIANERGMFKPTEDAIASGKKFPYAYGPTFSIKPSTFTIHDELHDIHNLNTMHFTDFLHLFATKGHNHFGIDIDMEEPFWIQNTVDTFLNAKRMYDNIDIVHQTNVDRTLRDLGVYIEKIDNLGVRLCIGIYDVGDEDIWSGQNRLDYHNNIISQIGTMNKKERKTRLIQYSKFLAKEGAYVKIATHDVDVIKHMEKWFNEKGISKDMYEFQGLYNVKPKGLEELHKQLIANKTRVRIYLPFAPTLDDAVFYGIRRACKNHQLLGTFSVGAVGYYAKKVLTLGMCK
jgi:hypothetical protein